MDFLIVRVALERFFIRGDGALVFAALAVSVAEHPEQERLGIHIGDLRQQIYRLVVFPLIGIKLSEAGEGFAGLRVGGHALLEGLLRLVALVAHPVESAKDNPGFRVSGFEAGDGFKLRQGLIQSLFRRFAGLGFTEIADVNAPEQTVGIGVFRVDLQDVLRLPDGLRDAADPPVKLGELGAQEKGIGVSLHGLLVFGNRLLDVFAPVVERVHLLIPARQHVVIIGASVIGRLSDAASLRNRFGAPRGRFRRPRCRGGLRPERSRRPEANH